MAAARAKNEKKLPVRLMFQDEARFGRMSYPRACWAPTPHRPMVKRALIREFRYEYAAVSPWDGYLDFMTAERMKSEDMSRFLVQVDETHKDDFVIMILDGAPSHKGKDLNIPQNMVLLSLPSYSPELNPTELLWNVLRRDYFANRVFDSLSAATLQAETGLGHMASDREGLKKLTNWSWINDILNAI